MSDAVILLFSGQGAQCVGMGRDLYEEHDAARALFDEAQSALDIELLSTMFAGPAELLTRTAYCQPALYLHGMALAQIWRERFPEVAIAGAAGLSLGEWTAHGVAGSFSFAEGLALVAARGRFMEEACESTQGSMAAVIGGTGEEVEALASECGVDVANYNCPGQIVLSGEKGQIAEVVARAKGYGSIRLAKELKVAGAYHSRLMQSAQKQMADLLSEKSLRLAQIPVVSNFTAQPVADCSAMVEALTNQVTGSVRWTQSMQYFIDQGHRTFVELGPGGVLAGLMKRISAEAEVISVAQWDDFSKIEWPR